MCFRMKMCGPSGDSQTGEWWKKFIAELRIVHGRAAIMEEVKRKKYYNIYNRP